MQSRPTEGQLLSHGGRAIPGCRVINECLATIPGTVDSEIKLKLNKKSHQVDMSLATVR